MLNPASLNDTFRLAKILKQYILSTEVLEETMLGIHVKKISRNTSIGSILGLPKNVSNARFPYQKISKVKIQERRRNDLCYFCEDKWQ